MRIAQQPSTVCSAVAPCGTCGTVALCGKISNVTVPMLCHDFLVRLDSGAALGGDAAFGFREGPFSGPVGAVAVLSGICWASMSSRVGSCQSAASG